MLARSETPLLSVVAPMYNEEGNVEPFVAAVHAALEGRNLTYEILLVDDGSRDETWERIRAQCGSGERVRGLRLARNFGHQNALFAGLHYARGRAVVSMDGDLQHPPRVIPELVEAWRSGFEVVTTARRDSAEVGWFKRLSSRGFYRVFSRLTGVQLTPGASDFRLLDRRALAAVLEMKDTDLFLRGIVSWLGFRSTTIPFQADERLTGHTKYSVGKMLRFSSRAMLSFSMLPLRMGIWLGFATIIFAFSQAALATYDYYEGKTVPGWASVMVLMSVLFSVVFVLLGSIGVYLGKIYEILRGRQRFVVSEEAGGVLEHSCAERAQPGPQLG